MVPPLDIEKRTRATEGGGALKKMVPLSTTSGTGSIASVPTSAPAASRNLVMFWCDGGGAAFLRPSTVPFRRLSLAFHCAFSPPFPGLPLCLFTAFPWPSRRRLPCMGEQSSMHQRQKASERAKSSAAQFVLTCHDWWPLPSLRIDWHRGCVSHIMFSPNCLIALSMCPLHRFHCTASC